MAYRTLSDEDFLAKALDLFRDYGFEGVSLKQLADATGLEKASLYYRYPGGKDEIVMAVAKDWLRNAFASFMRGERKRASRMCSRFQAGRRS